MLADGCPQVEFVPVVVGKPAEVDKALAMKDTVDGYLVYITTLYWPFGATVAQLGKLGKPLLVADEFLGGCGVFLTSTATLRRQGVPLAAVSGTRAADLMAVARVFADAKQPGMTPARFARRCEQIDQQTFAPPRPAKCVEDKVALAGIGECVKRLKESRFLIVGAGTPGMPQEFLGAKAIHVGFDEFQALYDQTDRDEAANPVEHLLHALAACMTTSMVAHAAVRGIPIEEVESEVEGDIDLMGFLGLSATVPKGFSNIRVRFRVKADADNMERLKRLAEFSPVLNTLTHGATVDVQVRAK